ncbi:flagellar biosynthetic protein FliO [Peristeroidobacter agariperforans]|uniref:flagellar biosynthetic protein FliO n=1 Tax=Peristeroidobacter agariperforans TaxID=268404 RepID=UPI00101D0F5F|nr:flagellar biosynthetic protein FliO [Peristeroidobacter agariperforans]
MPRTLMLSVIRGVALRGLAVTAAIGILCLAAPMVFGAEKFAAPEASQAPAAVGAGSLTQVTLSLLLVLGIVFAAAWITRRLRGFGKFGNGALHVVTEIAVGAKERVVLVQVGKQQLLVGVAPGRVSTLYVLDEPVTPQTPGTPVAPSDPRHPTDFKSILKRSLGL